MSHSGVISVKLSFSRVSAPDLKVYLEMQNDLAITVASVG